MSGERRARIPTLKPRMTAFLTVTLLPPSISRPTPGVGIWVRQFRPARQDGAVEVDGDVLAADGDDRPREVLGALSR